MTLVAVMGSAATTTSVALAASWPAADPRDVVIIEGDPSGGSLAAWFDVPLTPSLSSVVTALHHQSASGVGPLIRWRAAREFVRGMPNGVNLLPAPFRAREAARTVAEAERLLWAACSAVEAVVIVDAGRAVPTAFGGIVRTADFVVVTHRQHDASSSAAAVGFERLAEVVDALGSARSSAPDAAGRPSNGSVGFARGDVGVVLVGDQPHGPDEVGAVLAGAGAGDDAPPVWSLAADPLAAAVIAGRRGVSARRMGRLPLMRSATIVAAELAALVGWDARPAGDRHAPVAQLEVSS